MPAGQLEITQTQVEGTQNNQAATTVPLNKTRNPNMPSCIKKINVSHSGLECLENALNVNVFQTEIHPVEVSTF